MKRWRLLAAVLASWSALSPAQDAGKLGRLQEEARRGRTATEDGHDDDDDDGGCCLLGLPFVEGEPDVEPAVEGASPQPTASERGARMPAAGLALRAGWHEDSDRIGGAYFSGRLAGGPFLVGFDHTRYEESRVTGRGSLDVVHVPLGLRVGVEERRGARVWLEGGLTIDVLDGPQGTDAGDGYFLGLRADPAPWLSLMTRASGADFQDDDVTDLWDVEAEAGVGWRYLHLTAGYRDVSTEGVSLDGPTLGLAVTF
ncbi:MAG: hypothetical protein HY722_15430 [Planctomycetes bacterium]|nr:hypothetical protein [Planctomycetota bacterium]